MMNTNCLAGRPERSVGGVGAGEGMLFRVAKIAPVLPSGPFAVRPVRSGSSVHSV